MRYTWKGLSAEISPGNWLLHVEEVLHQFFPFQFAQQRPASLPLKFAEK